MQSMCTCDPMRCPLPPKAAVELLRTRSECARSELCLAAAAVIAQASWPSAHSPALQPWPCSYDGHHVVAYSAAMDTATPGRKQQTHDRILDTAARVLRDTGFYGVGVADIMKKAALTHGGFYAHFPSREALLVEALERAGADSRLRLQRS